jgi:hypothetical protein
LTKKYIFVHRNQKHDHIKVLSSQSQKVTNSLVTLLFEMKKGTFLMYGLLLLLLRVSAKPSPEYDESDEEVKETEEEKDSEEQDGRRVSCRVRGSRDKSFKNLFFQKKKH